LLLEAVYATYKGYSWLDPVVAKIILKHTRQLTTMTQQKVAQPITISAIAPERTGIPETKPLTNQEMQVLELIVQGYTNQKIAKKLYLSISGVKVYVRSILDKLCASDRTRAAIIALRAGLLE
jgi:DNA-binding NarL/FixJ family response regulator